MTLIVTDGKTIAADGLRMFGPEAHDTKVRKIKVVPPHIYAFAGIVSVKDALIDWHVSGADPAKRPHAGADQCWELLTLEERRSPRDGERQLVISAHSQATTYPCRPPGRFAVGSGVDYAIGAMLVGASPFDAIIAVSQLVPTIGGEIISLGEWSATSRGAEMAG